MASRHYLRPSFRAVKPSCSLECVVAKTIGRATEWFHVISKARVVRKFPFKITPQTGALFRAFQALGAFLGVPLQGFSLALSFNPRSSNDSDSVSIPSFLLLLISHSLHLTTVIPLNCIFKAPVFNSRLNSVHTHTHHPRNIVFAPNNGLPIINPDPSNILLRSYCPSSRSYFGSCRTNRSNQRHSLSKQWVDCTIATSACICNIAMLMQMPMLSPHN